MHCCAAALLLSTSLNAAILSKPCIQAYKSHCGATHKDSLYDTCSSAASSMQHAVCSMLSVQTLALLESVRHSSLSCTPCVLSLTLQDKQVVFEEWGALKPTTPFGQIPILQVGDTVAAQSAAIGEPAGIPRMTCCHARKQKQSLCCKQCSCLGLQHTCTDVSTTKVAAVPKATCLLFPSSHFSILFLQTTMLPS